MKKIAFLVATLLISNTVVFSYTKQEIIDIVSKHFPNYNVEVVEQLNNKNYILKMTHANQNIFIATDGNYIYPTVFDIQTKKNVLDEIQTKYNVIEFNPFKEQLIQVSASDKTNRILVVFTDFECPYCKLHYSEFQKNFKFNFPEGLNVFYVNYPLPFHKNAELMSRIFILGIKKYGKNLSKELFGLTNEQLNKEYIMKRFAIELGIPEQILQQEIYSDLVNKQLSIDKEITKKLNINATPTFLTNSKSGDKNKFHIIKNGTPNMIEIIKNGI